MTPSSGNVFADLGFPPGEAAHLELRSRLMDWLDKFITDKALTQRQAAQFFGVTQPRISNLVCGRLDLFSLDMLVEMLSRAGVRVEMSLHAGPRKPAFRTRPTAARSSCERCE
jgi:predicted XRE-type DNA-binding protein